MNRILIQSNNFKVSPVVYGQRIIEFYKKCDYACLKSQLECEVELADKHGSKACLLSDLVFVFAFVTFFEIIIFEQLRLLSR